MSGIAPDPPPSAEEHAYFQAIEEAFLRLRGKAVLLSASDWQVARAWQRAGMPLELVLQTMTELFARARERRGRSISALRYFKAAVATAWEEVESLSAGSRRERLEPIRIGERLTRLANALPMGLAGRERWGRALTELQGELEEVEARLAAMDPALLEEAVAALPAAARGEIERQVETALSGLRSRLPREELERSRGHLRAQLLRRQCALPLLSLFAPEARDPETGAR